VRKPHRVKELSRPAFTRARARATVSARFYGANLRDNRGEDNRGEESDDRGDEVPGTRKNRHERRPRLANVKFQARIVSPIRKQASEIAKTDHAGASRCCVNAEKLITRFV